jgi:GNAT superfamily N-acetyltransferase
LLNPSEYTISSLISNFTTIDFDSGNEELDEYLKKYALWNQKLNISQSFVLHHNHSSTIIGYYSLSTADVKRDELPEIYSKKLPHYPIPCILIGKLAVDKSYKGLGFGKYLLVDSLDRIKKLSHNVGCYAVIVDAIDENAVNFYQRYGFIEFIHKKNSLFLPVTKIPQSLNAH